MHSFTLTHNPIPKFFYLKKYQNSEINFEKLEVSLYKIAYKAYIIK